MALQQAQYRQAQPKLKEFERAFQAGEANLKVVFQVHEGPEGSDRVERWPEKLRRMAKYFRVKPNELANRMIAAGILALERETPTTIRISSSSIGRRSSFPRSSNTRARRNSPKALIPIRMFRKNSRVMAGPSWVSSK